MIVLEETLHIPRSVQDCFRYLKDFSTVEQWDPGVLRARKLTPGAVQEQSAFELVLRVAGRELPMRYTVTEIEANKRLVLRGEGDNIEALDTLRFEPGRGGGSTLHYRAELSFGGLAGLTEPVMRPFLQRYGRHTIACLGRALTPEAPLPKQKVRPSLLQRLILPAAYTYTRQGYQQMDNRGLSEYCDGKIMVITGATSGLGLAAACELARLGAQLILVGRDETRQSAAIAKIQAFSGNSDMRIHSYLADLSLVAEAQRVGDEIRRDFDHIDVLINNAGALYDEHQLTSEGHERALAINCLAPAQLFLSLRPALRGGQVINVLSGGLYLQGLKLSDMNYERSSYDGAKAYARAKRALLSLSEQWAQDTGTHGVRVNCMHPGWADTPGVRTSLPGFYQRLKQRLREPRMGADTIVWLATATAARHANGQFWFDRQPQPSAVVPGTAHSARQTKRLSDWADACLSG